MWFQPSAEAGLGQSGWLPGTIVPGYFQPPCRAEDLNTRIKFLVVVYALDELKYFIVSK